MKIEYKAHSLTFNRLYFYLSNYGTPRWTLYPLKASKPFTAIKQGLTLVKASALTSRPFAPHTSEMSSVK